MPPAAQLLPSRNHVPPVHSPPSRCGESPDESALALSVSFDDRLDRDRLVQGELEINANAKDRDKFGWALTSAIRIGTMRPMGTRLGTPRHRFAFYFSMRIFQIRGRCVSSRVFHSYAQK